MKQLLLVLFCLYAAVGLGQQHEDGQRVHGKVVDSVGGIQNVYVRNMSKSIFTITTRNGNFSLRADTSDTLRLSYMGYKDLVYILNESDFEEEGIRLQLQTVAEELSEVVVSKDTISALSLGIIQKEIKPKTQTERELFAASHMINHWTEFFQDGGILVTLDPLINVITGRTKELKEHAALEQDASNANMLYESFYVYLTTTLKIPEEEIMLFCYYLTDQEKDEALLKAETDLGELLITEYYQEYQQQKASE